MSSPLRASNEGVLFPPPHCHTYSLKGVARLSFTARIGRAPFHRARSASKKEGLAAPVSFLGRALREHRGLIRAIPPVGGLFLHPVRV